MTKEAALTYKFRQEPIAYCGRHHRYFDYFRQPKLGMVRRHNCKHGNINGRYGYDYEDTFCSNKYKEAYLPCWDDREKHVDRSWKTSFKVKKQWMKKLYMHKH